MTWRVTGVHHVAVAAGEDRTGEALFGSLLGAPIHTEEGDGFTERMYEAGGPFLQTLEAARTIAAWFPQTAPVVCELWGLEPALVAAVRDAYRGGEFQEAAAAAKLLPDDFVREVALAGGREQARGRIEAAIAAGADSVHVFPLGQRRIETIEAFAACFREVVGVRA